MLLPQRSYYFLGSHLELQARDAISQVIIVCGQARVAHPTGIRQLQGASCVGSDLGATVAVELSGLFPGSCPIPWDIVVKPQQNPWK